MIRHILTLSALLAFSLNCVFSQGEIRGKILDSGTGEPLPYVNVHVDYGSSIIGTTTDLDGKFILKPLEAGYYNVTCSFIGYSDLIVTGVQVSNNKIKFMGDLNMTFGLTLGGDSGLVVIGDRDPIINPEDPLAIPIQGDVFLEVAGGKDILGTLGKMIPQFYQPEGTRDAYVKGSRSDATGTYVDGMKSDLSGLNVPSCAIGEVTVYTGGVPARYGDLTGGVIVLETKSYFSLYNQWKINEERKKILGIE